MNTFNHNPKVADFAQVAVIQAKAIDGHKVYAYLASFADVAVGLTILISICCSSLLLLCTSLGVI
ncbi:hypothetical protein NP603_17615 [Methylomonas sp. SURF-1]|uniref:Uncharacterized protein n=1 Tax=Methylomonas aurea TaxID=2952224 RepID=A0ABT1UNG8_9GAMM|nr:hypothetical protein [Methylomonas sp. SURF-1]MCQ8182946.1 hypothetical protein [Methylomonas sp. SURF-1]